MAYPGNSVSFGYSDASGDFELSQIWYKTGSGTTISKFDYTYDALRRIKTWTMQAGNGTPQVLSPEYDNEDQLLGATLTQSGAPTKAYGYGYDDAGNRTGEQIETFTPTRALTITPSGYNNVNQLLPRTAPSTVPVRFRGTINEPGTVKVGTVSAKMTQDPASASNGKIFTATVDLATGSRTVSVVATDLSTRQGGPNSTTKSYSVSVAGGTSKSFGYDANGNCMLSGGTTYGWDGEDRLIAITNGVLTTELGYDGFGRRVSIIERNNGTVTSTKKFVWCGMDLAEELDGNNNATKQFFPNGQGIGPLSYYYTRDHLGSVREVFEYSGVVHARYDYDPYGRRGANQITSNPVEADFGFTGHYFHAPSGLHLAPFRAYDADTGRWLSRDPIEEPGGLNLYGYAGNNPISETDPLGLDFNSSANYGFDELWVDMGGNYDPEAGKVLAQPIFDTYGDFLEAANYATMLIPSAGGPAEAGAVLSGFEAMARSLKFPGTYKVCLKNGLSYVGKAVDVGKRLAQHVAKGKWKWEDIKAIHSRPTELIVERARG